MACGSLAEDRGSQKLAPLLGDGSLRTLVGLNVLLAAHFTVLARCAGAHEALRCVRIYEPDVLIIDQDMPAMDGVDVLKQLRAAGDQTPVVLLATANNSKLMEALAFNVEGIVFKQSEPKCLIR